MIAAFMLAIGVPTGVDLIDPRVQTLDELEGILDFPPLGVVRHGSSRTVNEPSDLAITEDSDRLASESLRRVAFAIIREWRASGVRNFVMVPVSGSAGNTALTLALALELSNLGAADGRNRGKSVRTRYPLRQYARNSQRHCQRTPQRQP